MVRAALIGVGSMGRKYMHHISEGRVRDMELTAAVARSEAAQDEIHRYMGEDFPVFASEEELYEQEGLFDAVIIATPHMLHPQMTLNALRHGKHVLCDKPLGIKAGDCRKVIAEADRSGLVFSVMFHQRVWKKYIRIRQLIEEGTLGTIQRVMLENSRYFRTEYYHKSGKWRSSWNREGGGMLINQGQHILDIWQWLFGMPDSLSAHICFGKYNDFTVDDEASLFMNYKDGKTGIFVLSTGEGTGRERLEVIGSKGTALLNENTLTLHLYDRDLSEYRKNEQVNAREHLHETVTVEDLSGNEETHPVILENFVRAITLGEPLIAEGADGIHALELTNAAYLSAWTGRETGLPCDDSLYERMLEEQQRRENRVSVQSASAS